MKEHCENSNPCSNSNVAMMKLSGYRPELVVNSPQLSNSVTSGLLHVAQTSNEGILTDRDHSECQNSRKARAVSSSRIERGSKNSGVL